jgi:hypothetical protein
MGKVYHCGLMKVKGKWVARVNPFLSEKTDQGFRKGFIQTAPVIRKHDNGPTISLDKKGTGTVFFWEDMSGYQLLESHFGRKAYH